MVSLDAALMPLFRYKIMTTHFAVGEASGKGSRSVAKHMPGSTAQLEALNIRAGTVSGEIAKTRMQLVERGQKLGELEERTGRMMTDAETFSSTAHQLMQKYKDKKWYQL